MHANEKKDIYQRNMQKWMPASGRGGTDTMYKRSLTTALETKRQFKILEVREHQFWILTTGWGKKAFCAFYLLLVFYCNHRIARGTLMSTAVEET